MGGGSAGNVVSASAGDSCYSQLSSYSRYFYNQLNTAGLKTGKIAIRLPYIITFQITNSALLANNFWNRTDIHTMAQYLYRAVTAFRFDRTDTYWIRDFNWTYGYRYVLNYRTGIATVYVHTVSVIPKKCYEKVLSDDAAVQRGISKAFSRISARRKNKSRYQTVKAIYEYVTDLITYGHRETYVGFEHTISGGLLYRYRHTAVCEGYALLFRILCLKFHIPCIIAVSDSHAWNYVKMKDGKWYGVDCTWGDTGIRKKYNYKWLLYGRVQQKKNDTGTTHKADFSQIYYSYHVRQVTKFSLPKLAYTKYK